MDTDRWQQYLGVQCNASGPSPASHSTCRGCAYDFDNPRDQRERQIPIL